jgi:DNA-directed RNA polymerase subunit H (RpoH/RPB5)
MNLTNVNYTIKEINQIIIINLLKMLERRHVISNIKPIYESMQEDITPNKSITIKLDNGNNCLVYIVNGKVTSITQNSPIDEFLSNNTNLQKFVIITEPSKKTFKQVMENYPNSESFFQREFMEDIAGKDICSEHNLLNSEEKDELLQNININNFSKIYSTDVMSRYYNAKVGDIFRVHRLNITSGKGVDYRLVTHGSLDILF